MGNLGATVDYLEPAEIAAAFRTLLETHSDAAVFHLGAHQETAANYLARLSDALPLLQNAARAAHRVIMPLSLPDTASAGGVRHVSDTL